MLTGFTYILFGTAHRVAMNYVTWFMVIYIISAYIRIYPKKWMNNNLICGVMLLVSVGLSAASVVVCAKTGHSAHAFVTDSNTFLAVAVGVFAFLFFKNLRIPYSRVINTIAASTFGVFCIHAHSETMRQWLWKDTLDNVGHYGDKLMPLYAVGCVLGIFAVCVIIDILRINLIEKPLSFLGGRSLQKDVFVRIHDSKVLTPISYKRINQHNCNTIIYKKTEKYKIK